MTFPRSPAPQPGAHTSDAWADRHPSTQQIMRYFTDGGHLSNAEARQVTVSCTRLATEMTRRLKDGPELTTGLRKLLEAKDCFVRSLL